jgi:hypothetical protein
MCQLTMRNVCLSRGVGASAERNPHRRQLHFDDAEDDDGSARADDDDEDEGALKLRAAATRKSSSLWVDKYTPNKYLELLSDEVCFIQPCHFTNSDSIHPFSSVEFLFARPTLHSVFFFRIDARVSRNCWPHDWQAVNREVVQWLKVWDAVVFNKVYCTY